MTQQPEAGSGFNPFLLWTDLGMRAAEMTIASLQNVAEGAERLARAGASADAAATVEPSTDADARAVLFPLADFGGMASVQRLMWDLVTQGWLRWASAAGNLLSAGAGVELARKMAGRGNPLEAARASLQSVPWASWSAGGGEPGDIGTPRERRANRVSADTPGAQHALASNGPKQRRKAAAKPRRAQRSARK